MLLNRIIIRDNNNPRIKWIKIEIVGATNQIQYQMPENLSI